MVSENPMQGGPPPDREAALRARIAELEARLQRHAAELESTYALLGRERAGRLRTEAALRREHSLCEALFEHSPIGIRIFDHNGFSLRMNEAQRELLGLTSRDDGTGHFNALTDPFQIVSGAADSFRRAYDGEAVHLTDQALDLATSASSWQTTGRTIRYNQDLFPLFDEQGAIEAVLSFTEDIGESYTTRQALSTATQLIEGIFEHAPLAMQIFDRKGFSFRMNESNRRLLGVPTREYGTGEFNALTDPFMVAQGHAALYAKAYAGEVVRVPTLTIDLDGPPNSWGGGRTVRLEQILFPILDEDEMVTAVVSCTLEAATGTRP